jgi:hypothetical protein
MASGHLRQNFTDASVILAQVTGQMSDDLKQN